METLKADSGGKRKLLVFTLGKTQDIQESGNVLAINRHREALSTIVNQIDILKLQVVEERFKEGNSEEDITKLSTEIEDQVVQVDIKVTHINEHLASLKSEEDSKAQETEKELKAKEREEQKLEYEWKIEESKKDRATKSSEAKASPASEGACTVSGCVAPLPCRPRLCRPNRSYVAPTSELCRPNIMFVSPQHQSCVALTRNFVTSLIK